MKLLSKINNVDFEQLLADESIFSTANGYLGIRGNFCEGYGNENNINGAFINGLYEEHSYSYEENFPGFAQTGQSIVNLIDGQSIEFLINGKPINMTTATVLNLSRHYNLEEGFTLREIHYITSDGMEFVITEKRLVSFEVKELFAINITIKSINYKGKLIIKSKLKLPEINDKLNNDPRTSQSNQNNLDIIDIGTSNQEGFIIAKTKKSEIKFMTSVVHTGGFESSYGEDDITALIEIELTDNQKFSFNKNIIYTSDLHHDNFIEENKKILLEIKNTSFEKQLYKQKEFLEIFWNNSKIDLYGNDELETVINYNLYQLNSSGSTDSRFSIAAKGLSGSGYEGHYFWDTEIYMLPFFTLTNKEKAKSLLMYRYKNLQKSRDEAIALGHKQGVKIPWRTINGNEVSPFYPAGTAQYHINSDIAYAFIKYYEATLDIDLIIDYGFEVIYETAKALYEIGNFSNGVFHINNVTGPDEYTTCVDDNYYTNTMAQYHFKFVYDFYTNYKNKIKNVVISTDELNNFALASQKMNLIFDKKLNIYAQDRSFLDKKKWDFENTPKSNYPLLLNYHPLMIYRHQVLKQADVLLSMFLLDYKNESILKSTFEYYNEITTHDSSLSKCVHCIIAAKLGDTSLAYDYLIDISNIDLFNTHNNTSDGLHIANMGGSYLAILYGFGGVRIHDDYLIINPVVPSELEGYKFIINYHGSHIEVLVKDKVYVSSTKKVQIKVYNKTIDLLGNYEVPIKL